MNTRIYSNIFDSKHYILLPYFIKLLFSSHFICPVALCVKSRNNFYIQSIFIVPPFILHHTKSSQTYTMTEDTQKPNEIHITKAIIRLYKSCKTFSLSMRIRRVSPYMSCNTRESRTLYNTNKGRYYI